MKPASIRLALRKAKFLMKRGQLEEARLIYESILRDFPCNSASKLGLEELDAIRSNPQKERPAPWETDYQTVLDLSRRGEHSEALSLAQSSVKNFPSAYALWEILGIVAQKNKLIDVSISAFTKAVELNPKEPLAHSNLGLALHEGGQSEKARQSLVRATVIDPTAIQAFYNLGVVLYDGGLFSAAQSSLESALAIKPNYAEALNHLGLVFYSQDELPKAIQTLRRAIKSNPMLAEAHYNLGLVYSGSNQMSHAIESYQNTLKIEPNHLRALNNLGAALRLVGQLSSASAVLEQAISLKPDYVEAINNLGNVLLDAGSEDEALKYYKEALCLNPDYASAHNNLGTVLRIKNKVPEAIAHYKKAIKLNPDYAEAINNMGIALSDMGDKSAAAKHFAEAIGKNPSFASAWRNLATTSPESITENIQLEMGKLWEHSNLRSADRCELAFGMYEFYKFHGRTDTAFSYLQLGNALRQEQIKYDLCKDKNLFSQLTSTADKWLENLPVVEATQQTPIFIVGMPRSGTTLIEQILSSHSGVTGLGELRHIGDILGRIPNSSHDKVRETVLYLRNEYYTRLSETLPESGKFTDKMPFNFLWIPALIAAFPDGKIIHVHRNPAATCWSNFERYFPTSGLGFSYSLKNVVGYYQLYYDLVSHYESLVPNRIYHLNYESLTEHLEETLLNLSRFLELDFESAMLSPHLNSRVVTTASSMQVREKIYKGSSNKWKDFAAFLGSEFDELRPFNFS